MQLRSVRFNWKNNKTDGQKLGVIAQEIQKVLPEVVRDYTYTVDEATGKKTRLPSERLGVIYSDIIPVLIKGMQEQQQQIDALKQLVEQLTQSISATDNTNTANNMVVANETNLEQNTPNPKN